MSLVAYDSSDDSDRDDAPSPDTWPASKPGLFAALPPPKSALSVSQKDAEIPAHKKTSITADLPRPKKRSEPVKITVPEIKAADSDSDEDEPVRKKMGPQGAGLSALLPQPKNLILKEMQRPLVPHALTKQSGSGTQSKSTKAAPASGMSGTSPSPSAIKAAAKSAAMQLARQMAADEDGSDEDGIVLSPENYFSLAEGPSQLVTPPYTDSPAIVPSLNDPSNKEDTPLDFGSNAEAHTAWSTRDYQRSEYLPQNQDLGDSAPTPCPQDYYSEGYYQDANPGQEEPEASTLFNDEAFRRLQGKQNRGKEEIKFLEIKGDDQLSGSQQWMTKNMTQEPEQRKSFSKKKGDQPTGQQRRKHQITYLIHQAKERELELKNNWADNKISRRQTQAKYGF